MGTDVNLISEIPFCNKFFQIAELEKEKTLKQPKRHGFSLM
jgi:hypothetical protein